MGCCLRARPALRVSPAPAIRRRGVGASPSGKAADFDSAMRRFEILPPQPRIPRFRRLRRWRRRGPHSARLCETGDRRPSEAGSPGWISASRLQCRIANLRNLAHCRLETGSRIVETVPIFPRTGRCLARAIVQAPTPPADCSTRLWNCGTDALLDTGRNLNFALRLSPALSRAFVLGAEARGRRVARVSPGRGAALVRSSSGAGRAPNSRH